MVKVIIPYDLECEIDRKFGGDSRKIFRLLRSVKDSPRKGKLLGVVDGVAIKELKYKSFRFYFLVDAHGIKFLGIDELKDLVIKFVRMSDKNSQQKVIKDIKDFLRKIGASHGVGL